MWSLVVFSVSIACVFGAYIPSDRIVGGHDVSIEQRPFQVSIVLYGQHFCGGSIIRKNVILTAAHCLRGVSGDYIQIRVGSTLRTSGGRLVEIKKTIYHEDYIDATAGLDVGLIWLKESLQFDSSIKKIDLPEQGEVFADRTTATVSGWGLLSVGGSLPEILQEVNVPLVNRDVCNQEFRGMINNDMICAGYDEGGSDACQMDSGGPLTVGVKQAGIVSFGFKCAEPQYAGVYTNIAHFRDWIDEKIRIEELSSSR